MTQDDIHRIARELYGTGATEQEIRFAILVAAAQREKIAAWMWNMGYATGHGDTIEGLLDHLGTQIAEGLEADVLMEREACARIAETKGGYTHLPTGVQIYGSKAAAAIRARSKE
jgi:hypothetical protein